MKKICLIGQFPPPIHGLSKALETIVNSEVLNGKFNISYIDIKENKRIMDHINKIKNDTADIYYFTISQTKLGNIRDMFLLQQLLAKKKKVIIHYHGGYYKKLYSSFNFIQKKINKRLIGKVNIMIALSESLKYLFTDVISLDRVRVCENFIENSSLISDDLFEKKLNNMSNPNKKLQLLYLSNFIESKGYKDLLQSIVILKSYNIMVNFAGAFFSKKDEEEFFNYVENHGLIDQVTYHGVVKSEEKKELLFRSDIFILPTYYPKEGQPISIIEAMGNGLAIITTNHAGIPDIVRPKSGVIINPKSPNEIASAVIELKTEGSLIDIARYNREYTLNNFRESDYIYRLEKIFNEVIR